MVAFPSSPSRSKASLTPSKSENLPRRCAASLQAPQEPLVEFLASGRGYDDKSVAAAIRDANASFDQKDYGRARDLFGVAYEIGRLHHAYRPLMHDLLLRRVLCHSILGDFSRALQECDIASALIPNEASVCLLRGIVSSKLGNASDANLAFQKAVILDKELRDLVDCMVSFFSMQNGYCDRAIKICDQVLKRTPKHSLALLLRGDAYKFHPAGWAYHKQSATNDYTNLLEVDLGLQHLIARAQPGPSQHARADELLLFFPSNPSLPKSSSIPGV
jgi:tetratricopeptide (TPR) repeat protein